MVKHCPECHDEFRPEIATCPDCEVALVVGPARSDREGGERTDEVSVTLIRTRDRLFLTRLAGILEEAEIHFELSEGIVLSAIVGEIAQPIRVLVLERDLDAANEIVAALQSGIEDEEAETQSDPIEPN